VLSAQVEEGGSGQEVVLVEISPLVSYAGEGLEHRVSGHKLIPPIHIM
jgi:hypothetical protein